jgi:hypothetical protein
MGLFDRLRAGLGVQRPLHDLAAREDEQRSDEQAIARYRYMLRTAPPEAIEQAHAEAFAQLSPQQRQRLLHAFAADMPDAERAAALRADASPAYLARAATRAEVRQPGAIERTMGSIAMPVAAGPAASAGFAPAFPGAFTGSLLAGMAGSVLGSVIAQRFFTHHDGPYAPPQPLLDAANDVAGNASATEVARDVNAGLDTFGETPSGAIDDFDSDDNYGGFDSSDTFDV